MNARRSQLRWPAAAVAATTLLALAFFLGILYQQRPGVVSGSLTRLATSHAPRSGTGTASTEHSASRDTYEVRLLPPRTLRDADHTEAAAYGPDEARQLMDPEVTTQAGKAPGLERVAAKMPPEAVRRWLLPIRPSHRLP